MVSKVRNVRLGVFSGGGCHHPNSNLAARRGDGDLLGDRRGERLPPGEGERRRGEGDRRRGGGLRRLRGGLLDLGDDMMRR